jgi:hypothetical protein
MRSILARFKEMGASLVPPVRFSTATLPQTQHMRTAMPNTSGYFLRILLATCVCA